MRKVMIVDDEPMIRFGIRASIDWEREGFACVGDYANGAEALKALEANPADIVITDIKMPLMDGLELAAKAMERYPAIKIILVSSYNEFEYARQGLRLGVTDYLLKPTLEPEELLALLHACSAKIEEERTNAASPRNEEGEQADAVACAMIYIQEHYREPITLKEVADAVHISKNYFSILFKKTTGRNFIDVVIDLRIKKAEDLLATSGRKVYEVAEQAGFQDVKYFGKMFKRITGLSPQEFRDRARPQKRQE